MKKFKSILALTASVLALSAFAAPVSAFANDTNTNGTWDDNPAGTTNFSLAGPAEGYIVTIPATITFDAVSGSGATKTGTIEATNVFLNDGDTLTVTATSTQYTNSKYHLMNGDAAIAYTATFGTGDTVTTVSPSTTLLSVPSGTTQNSNELTFAIDEGQTCTVAGDYTDTWTFTVAVSS